MPSIRQHAANLLASSSSKSASPSGSNGNGNGNGSGGGGESYAASSSYLEPLQEGSTPSTSSARSSVAQQSSAATTSADPAPGSTSPTRSIRAQRSAHQLRSAAPVTAQQGRHATSSAPIATMQASAMTDGPSNYAPGPMPIPLPYSRPGTAASVAYAYSTIPSGQNQASGSVGRSGAAGAVAAAGAGGPPQAVGPVPRPPLQRRFYGLDEELRQRAENASPSHAPGQPLPVFSVEVKAPSFDSRDQPVFSGRAPLIRGVVRMPADIACDVELQMSAHTTLGAQAWEAFFSNGFDSSNARKVFATVDVLSPNYDKDISARPPTKEQARVKDWPRHEDYILSVPFDINLPLGCATAILDGTGHPVLVPLPPSFEVATVSSEKERDRELLAAALGGGGSGSSAVSSSGRSIMSLKGRSKGAAVKDAVEKGIENTYKFGCFYSMTFTLKRTTKKGADSRANFLRIPFIFLGEAVPGPFTQLSIPRNLTPALLSRGGGAKLGDDWEVHRTSLRWGGSGALSKKNVEIEMHIPSPPIVYAPSAVPILLILRPTDPRVLPPPRSWPSSPSSPAGSQGSLAHEPMRSPKMLTSRSSDLAYSDAASDSSHMRPSADLSRPGTGSTNAVTRWMRGSLNLSRMPSTGTVAGGGGAGGGKRQGDGDSDHGSSGQTRNSLETTATRTGATETTVHGESAPGGAGRYKQRPSTAPSFRSTSSPSASTFMPLGSAHGGTLSLIDQVRVSLIRIAYCNSSNVNQGPEKRKKIVSVADLEEVDLATLYEEHPDMVNTQLQLQLQQQHQQSGTGEADATLGASPSIASSPLHSAILSARASGVRAIRGFMRIGSENTPSFRVQGLELRYAIKLDVLPSSTVTGGIGGGSSPPGALTNALRSLGGMRAGSNSSRSRGFGSDNLASTSTFSLAPTANGSGAQGQGRTDSLYSAMSSPTLHELAMRSPTTTTHSRISSSESPPLSSPPLPSASGVAASGASAGAPKAQRVADVGSETSEGGQTPSPTKLGQVRPGGYFASSGSGAQAQVQQGEEGSSPPLVLGSSSSGPHIDFVEGTRATQRPNLNTRTPSGGDSNPASSPVGTAPALAQNVPAAQAQAYGGYAASASNGGASRAMSTAASHLSTLTGWGDSKAVQRRMTTTVGDLWIDVRLVRGSL